MLSFPNCKINLGLNVIERRPDGFHNIETVFYKVGWCEALEVVEAAGGAGFELIATGIPIKTAEIQDNILYKAWVLLKKRQALPNLRVYLHKVLPMGAGLGGGSADAAFFLKTVNRKFSLGISSSELIKMAAELGSDCAFFMENRPVFATGKGEVFEEINLSLENYYLLVVYPGINSNTAEAYRGIVPASPPVSVKKVVTKEPIELWKDLLVNDFEKSIFKIYPEIEKLKNSLYEKGAVYASMSGSGSAVYGIFKKKPATDFPENYMWYLQEPV
ncbi:MAG: 4-(cytidine 5'-diphospho)-2-C-methyl-D-erythritol kinase [Bacteroidia bacterium]